MKKGLVAAVILLVVSFLVVNCVPAPTPTPATPTPTPKPKLYKWRLAQVHPVGSDYDKRARAFADEVREKTEGRIDITVYSGGVLGDWTENFEMVMRGALDMALTPIAPTYDPRLNIAYYLPYVAETVEKAKLVYTPGGVIYDETLKMLEPLNIKGLAVFPVGAAGCTLRECPPSPGDPDVPKKMKIRVMPLRLCELTYKRLGYIPTAIPYAECYSAIQTGVVDGEMGGPPFQGYQFRDIQGCWIQYNDYFETWWFFMNKKLWDELSVSDQKILLDAANKQALGRWDYVVEEDEKYRRKMEEYGLKIVMLSDEELAKCANAIRKDVWPEMEKLVGKALMDKIYAAVGIER